MSFSAPCCIQVRDLRVVFPNGHEALKSISMDVPRDRLVGQDDARLLREGTGNRDPLLLPTGQAVGAPLGAMEHPDTRHRDVCAGVAAALSSTVPRVQDRRRPSACHSSPALALPTSCPVAFA
jgi:hypothetical protein